jgi:fimbrial chaperone protein
MNLRLPLAAFVALTLLGGVAHARGQLQARQTSVDMPPGVRGGRLVLGNGGDSPVAAQIRIYAWTQDGDQDVLEPSNDLTVSPPVVEIAGGADQLIRLVRNSEAAPRQELAYRVVVDELPGDPAASTQSAVNVRMRYLIPVFVRVADPAPVALKCSLEAAVLACSNSGGVAAQLGASRLLSADGSSLELTPGLMGYVLAGSSRRFTLESDKLGSAQGWKTLEVRLNGQPASIELSSGR